MIIIKLYPQNKNLLKPYIIKVIVSVLQLLNRIDWDNTALFTTLMKEKDLWLFKNQGKLQTFDLFWCIKNKNGVTPVKLTLYCIQNSTESCKTI